MCNYVFEEALDKLLQSVRCGVGGDVQQWSIVTCQDRLDSCSAGKEQVRLYSGRWSIFCQYTNKSWEIYHTFKGLPSEIILNTQKKPSTLFVKGRTSWYFPNIIWYFPLCNGIFTKPAINNHTPATSFHKSVTQYATHECVVRGVNSGRGKLKNVWQGDDAAEQFFHSCRHGVLLRILQFLKDVKTEVDGMARFCALGN